MPTHQIKPEPVPATQQLQLLRQIHRAALDGQTPQQLCQNAFAHLSSLIDFERATLLLFDLELNQAQIFATSESESPFNPGLISTGNWVAMGKLREGLPYIADDLVQTRSNGEGQVLPRSVRSCVTVPLLADQILFGALNVWATRPRAFSPAGVELIQALAEALALVLALARHAPQTLPAGEQQAGLPRATGSDNPPRPIQTQQFRTVVSSLAVIRDITERKRANQTLKETDLKYRTLVEQLPAISYIVEFHDHQAHMTYISPQVETLLGFSPEEWLAAPDMLVQRLHPDDRASISSEFQRRHSGGQHEINLEYRLLTRDEQVVWFRDQVRFINDETAGGPYLQGIMFDITTQKQLETQFIQAQKLEAVGVLAGGVAHNFNNLLTALIGHTEFALDLLDPGHGVYPDLLSIKKNALRAANLTQQLLAFTRNQVTQSQVVDLSDIVRQLKPMLAQLVTEEFELVVNLASEPVFAKVDVNQIEQLLINLVANARDAMPDGGQITIQTAEVTFQSIYVTQHAEIKPGRYAMLAVNDTGEGIAAEVLPRVFDPFFTTKPPGQGTGLGLSTCFGIAKQHGGQITVESRFNRGTSVRIYLPVGVKERPVWIEQLHQVTQPEGTETILVVEDEPGVRRMTARALEQRGYTVFEAESGPQALRLLDDGSLSQLHLLVTDFIMPHMRGDVLVEQVRKRYPGLKVVFISGYGDREIEAKIKSTEQALYLTKPFEPETLLAQVRLALDGRFE